MAGFRPEDYVAFLDESGETGLQVVAGVLIPARWLRPAERRWRAFVASRFGFQSGRAEFKARELVRGNGSALNLAGHRPDSVSARTAGQAFFKEALEHIGEIAEVRVLSVGARTNQAADAYRLWFWLAYAALADRPSAPRPRLPMVVIDGEDASFRGAHDLIAHRFHRYFPRCQPYVGAGNSWFIGGAVHQDSSMHPFIQMADLVAFAARRSIATSKYGTWYDRHLRAPALARGRAIDVGPYALTRLTALDPTDVKKTGWRQVCLPL